MENFCSRCGARLDSSAKFCSSCGSQVNTSPNNSDSEHRVDVTSESKFCCPSCQSENVQRFAVIYSSGISSSDSATLADKFVAVTKELNMTALARSLAPPKKKENDWFWTVVCAFATFLFLDDNNGLMFFIFLCGTGYLLKENWDTYNYNNNIWPKLYDTWLHSYFCHRCGNIFVVR